MTHVKVNALPPSVQSALASFGYARQDISVTAETTFSLRAGSAQGRRAFVCVVNLETGEKLVTYGSWGGANMFNPTNAVDLDDEDRPLPPNVVVIHGSEGNSVFADLEVNPATLAPMLPAAPTIDDRDARILACYRSLKSGPYRKEALAKLKCSDEDIKRLCALGLLKQSSNGATQITTDGKNACAHVRGML